MFNINTLNDFIKILEKENELVRITQYINPELEVTEIIDRLSKSPEGGKAVLFENTGKEFPILINALGSVKRMSLALRVSKLEELGEQIENLIKELNEPKNTIFEKLKLLPRLKELSSWLPKEKKGQAVCQQNIIKNPDLEIFPILKCWPHDGGKFITFPVVHTKDPITGIRNVGMYRMQVFEKNLTGMHWHKHKTGARHYQEYKKIGKKMPVAVILGGDPVYTYVSTAPLPDNIDEYMLAGFIRKKRVELVKCISQDIEIPADSDIVIEGFVDTQEDLIWEGPFGDHTGFYSLPDWYPKFHVTCITYRNNAIYPATIVGIPPMEDAYIAKATERIFFPLIKTALVPEIIDLNIPDEGVAHNLTIAKIKKSYPGQALKTANALWGAGQMMFNKTMIIVDEHTSTIKNYRNLIKEAIKNFNPTNDIHFSKGPLDVLDHSSNKFAYGSKILFDATKKFDEEKSEDNYSTNINSELNQKDFVKIDFVKDVNLSLIAQQIPIIFISIKKKSDIKLLIKEISQKINLSSIKITVIADYQVDIDDVQTTVWLTANNIEPLRDCHILKNESSKNSIMFIDGTRKNHENDNFKRDWPNIVTMDEATQEKINNLWNKLNLGEFIESPSLKFKNLVYNSGAVAE